jgi:hypothetical protein
MLAALRDLRASEDPQDKSMVGLAEAFTAAACGQPENALHHARAALAHADALSISSESLRWAWPLAARMAYELGDNAAVGDLIALLDSHQPGHLAPILRAERDLARARLAEGNGDGEAAAAVFAAAIDGLRERSTRFTWPMACSTAPSTSSATLTPTAASLAVEEARDIGRRLRCQPLLDRANALERAQPGIRA